MLPVDAERFRLNLMNIDLMNEEIEFQLDFDEELSPRVVLAAEVEAGLKEHITEKAEIEEALLQRINSVMVVLTDMLQKMKENDSNGPALTQLANLKQSIQELEMTKEGSSEDLAQANNVLREMQRKYKSMKIKFQQMQEMHKKAQENPQLNSFVRGTGDMICNSIRINSCRR